MCNFNDAAIELKTNESPIKCVKGREMLTLGSVDASEFGPYLTLFLVKRLVIWHYTNKVVLKKQEYSVAITELHRNMINNMMMKTTTLYHARSKKDPKLQNFVTLPLSVFVTLVFPAGGETAAVLDVVIEAPPGPRPRGAGAAPRPWRAAPGTPARTGGS